MKYRYSSFTLMLVLSIIAAACGGRVDNSNNGGVINGGNGGGGNGWHSPVDLSDAFSPVGGDCEDNAAAMDSNGNAIIVWAQQDNSTFHLYKSEYRGGVWTHPANIADYIGLPSGYVQNPAVAMDDTGNAIIVWEDHSQSTFRIFKSEYRNGVWTHPTAFSDAINPDGGSASFPRVAMDNNGDAIIVWQQDTGGSLSSEIFMSEYRNGVWIHPISIDDYISPVGYPAYTPRVGMDDNGNAIIAWEQDGGYSEAIQIFLSEYRNGMWRHPLGIDNHISPSNPYGDAENPELAMDNNGDAIVVWNRYDQDLKEWQTFKSEYRNGVWRNPIGIGEHIPAVNGAANPVVAMSDNGNAVIAYIGNDGWIDQLFKCEYRDGQWIYPMGSNDSISIGSTVVHGPEVAIDNAGNAIITWFTNNQVFKSEYRNGVWNNPSGDADSLNSGLAGVAYPKLVIGNPNSALITWMQSNGSNYRMYKSEYHP